MTNVNTIQTMTMVSAVKISTTNDVNGNPRRLWIVSELVIDGKNDPHSNRVAIVEEGYAGVGVLRKHFPNVIITEHIEVSASEYRKWAKQSTHSG